MAEDKLEWVFDSLVEFLKGPVWNIPILTFIEQKSVVFEPGAENEEEFKKIHEKYKNLDFLYLPFMQPRTADNQLCEVDFMLGSYMEDIQITPEQFEKACAVASKKALTQFHQNLFEQVWAADDFEIFRRMMTQKNLELQLQALEVLAQKYGLSPDFMEPTDDCKPTKEEEKIMKEIIRKTVEEQQQVPEEETEIPSEEESVLKEALSEKNRLESQRQKEKELMDMAVKMSLKETQEPAEPEVPPSPTSPPTPNPSPTTERQEEEEEGSESMNAGADGNDDNDDDDDDAKTDVNRAEEDANTIPKTVSPTTLIAIAEAVSMAQESSAEPKPETEEASSGDNNDASSTGSSAGSMNVEVSSPTPSKTSPLSLSPLKPVENSPAPVQRPWSDGIDLEYTKTQAEVAPIEMERRQNYLRQQRDKLLALKRQERAKNLTTYEKTSGQQRPRSARAARKILREDSEDQNIDPQTLAFRKSLASRLKNEVVDKTA